MIQLGFHPLSDDLDVALAYGPFARALVIDETISRLYDEVEEVRVSDEIGTGLASGLYWFTGLSSPLVMQVATGPAGASEVLQFEDWGDSAEHPLVEAMRWAEYLWSSARIVPAPKFGIGERAITIPGGADVEIRTRAFDARSWSYQVRGDGALRSELESKLEAIEARDEPAEWVLGERASAARFGATLTRTKIRGRFVDTVYSFRATRTVFRPYQFKPVLKLLQTGQARILIADEVGLGKTIEAGLIWTELEARHEADRVLIVCPAGLVDKWRDEMQERFGFDATQLDGDELRRFLEQHREGRLPRRKSFVVSLEALRSWEGLQYLENNPPEFDLVIVDEAHAMRNSDTKSYQLGTRLAEWTAGSNMVFLTATPINLRETDLLHLLGLLEPADYESIEDLELRLEPNAVLNRVGRMLSLRDVAVTDFEAALAGLSGLAFEKAVTVRPEFDELMEIVRRAPLAPKDIARARRLLGELNALATTVTRTRRAEVDEKKAVRDAEPGVRVIWNPAESAFYEEYLRWCGERAALANTPLYFSMQMPIRLASTSIHLAAREVLGADPEVWAGEAEGLPAPRSVAPHRELIEAARRVAGVPDTKMARLAEVLEELHVAERQALLFSWSKATLRHLQSKFEDRYRIAVLNGDVGHSQRRTIMKRFRAGEYDFVFANKVASEGLDFEFCSAVINYDLPWNPMEIEQRIGRIDRIGQRSEKILIRNFYNDEAIDSRILFKVLERIDIFERSVGELEPIIGAHMDVLRAAMDFRLTPEQQEAKAQQFLTAIEAQRQGLREVADSAAGLIISSDVDVAGLEEELVATGRYLGQFELARLLEDWAYTDGAPGVVRSDDGKSIEFVGNPGMADRIIELTQTGRRNRSETAPLIADLKNQMPIHLALDQELARTSGVDILSATHPLVIAAADVPGHRHARFASVRVRAAEGVSPGEYVVVLAHAEHATRGGDEIWGSAVNHLGELQADAIADSVLAALAAGSLMEGSVPSNSDMLPRLATRAKRGLERRRQDVQERRDVEEGALNEARRALLEDQHERRMRGIRRRMQTMIERDRSDSVLHMVEGQRRRQQERYELLVAELGAKRPSAVSLVYLAVCVLEVVA